MLKNLLNVPSSKFEWAIWSFSNRTVIAAIRQAIQVQHTVNLTEYVLDPLDLDNPQGFLQNNGQAHRDFNLVLGAQSSDLEEVDIKDRKALEGWIYANYQELYTASSILKI